MRVAKFWANSLLHMYLSKECPDMITINHDCYTMPLILNALFHVIDRKKLFDPRNQECIICDAELKIHQKAQFFCHHLQEVEANSYNC